jgi:hypothetical protein
MAEEHGPGTAASVAAVYPTARPTDSQAILALVLGVLSPIGALFYGLPGVVLGALAIFFGLRSRRRIKKAGGALAGGGMALAGWIVGAVGLVTGLLWFAFLFALFMAMISGGSGAKGGPP